MAIEAGVGAHVRLELGGKLTPFLRPLLIEGTVMGISDGMFVQRGPYQAGQKTTLGPAAVIQSEGSYILVTSVAGMTQDPEAFLSQGIDFGNVDFVVTKSGNHFKLNFEGLAEPLVALTPGLSAYSPGTFPFKRARVCPDHDVGEPTIEATVFGASHRGGRP